MSNGHLLTRRGVLAALALLAVAGCGGSEQGAHGDVHWDYDAEGPDHWADLDSRFVTCRSGHAQSPIDLPAQTELHPDDHIEIEYRPLSTVDVVNNGHTVQANVGAGSGNRIVVDGAAFELTQFHFHLPSEHTVDGAEAAMELHFVHADPAGRLAVLAVLLRAWSDPSPLGQVLAVAPDRVGVTRTVSGIDPRAYLPTGFAQFRYEGSLTTPPCTEGVRWIVLRESAPVAVADVERYRALFPHTNRPVQPRFGRPVVLAGPN